MKRKYASSSMAERGVSSSPAASASSTSGPALVVTSEFCANFIDNELVTSNAERWMLVTNPITDKVITRVPRSTTAEIERAVDSSALAYTTWSATNKGERLDRLFDLAALIRVNETQIANVLMTETGKTPADALSEVRRGVDMVKSAAASIEQMGERGDMRSSMQIFTDNYPIGVCVTISPFNMPFLVPLWSIPYALAMGNTVVFKPSELCPNVGLCLAALIRLAGFGPGIFNLVNGDSDVASQLIQQPAVRAVSFVGSEKGGLVVRDLCHLHRKRLQANVSGMNHVVIMPDSPKLFALNAVVESCFAAAGQRCTSPKIAIMVGDSASWMPDLVDRARRLVVGNGRERRVDFGPLITRDAKERVLRQIQAAIDEGMELELDGRNLPTEDYPTGNWLGATVLSGVKPEMETYQEEIVGPVLICMVVESLDEAISVINKSRFGNGCSIMTNSGAAARRFQRLSNVGIVNINHPSTAPPPGFSFSSNKDSFLGENHFYGQDAIRFFTYTKTVTSLWHHPDQEKLIDMPNKSE